MNGMPWARRALGRIARMLRIRGSTDEAALGREWETISIRVPKDRAGWYREAVKTLTMPESIGPDGVGIIAVAYTVGDFPACGVVAISTLARPLARDDGFNVQHCAQAASAIGAVSGCVASRLEALVQATAASGFSADPLVAAYSEGWFLGRDATVGRGGSVDDAIANLPPEILRMMEDPPSDGGVAGAGGKGGE